MRKILLIIFSILSVSQMFANSPLGLKHRANKEIVTPEINVDSIAQSSIHLKLDSLSILCDSLLKSCNSFSNMPATNDWVSSKFSNLDLLSGTFSPECVLIISIIKSTPAMREVHDMVTDYSNLLLEMSTACQLLNVVYQKDSVNLYKDKLLQAKVWVNNDKQRNDIDSLCNLLKDYRWGTKMLLENIVEAVIDAQSESNTFNQQVAAIVSDLSINQDIEKIPYLKSRYKQLKTALHKQKHGYRIEDVDWDFVHNLQVELIECRKE